MANLPPQTIHHCNWEFNTSIFFYFSTLQRSKAFGDKDSVPNLKWFGFKQPEIDIMFLSEYVLKESRTYVF